MRENPKKARWPPEENSLDFGSFGLVAQESKEVWANQIEAARKRWPDSPTTPENLDKNFTDMPITKKPAEVGMGRKERATGLVLFTESGRAMCSLKWTVWMRRLAGEASKERRLETAGKNKDNKKIKICRRKN